MVVPYGASGYRYLVVEHGAGAGFEAPAFDDSGFSTGAAAFGAGHLGCPLESSVKTTWPLNKDILVRRTVNIPAGTSGVIIGIQIDNNVKVYWNGTLVGSQDHAGCAHESLVVPVPDALVQSGDNVLAVRGDDRGVVSHLDIQVIACAPALDQQQTNTAGVEVVTPSQTFAQTFTAGISGRLNQVDLVVARQNNNPDPLIVELRDTADGRPGSTVLASQSVPATSMPNAPSSAFFAIPFTSPAQVVAGNQYAIVARSTGHWHEWTESSGNVYAGGAQFAYSSLPEPWVQLDYDFAFKTYVRTDC